MWWPSRCAADHQGAAAGKLGDPMHEGILNERLQREGRHHRIDVVRNLPLHREAVGETHLLDVKISTRQFELVRECDFLHVARAECGAKQVGQPDDGALRQCGITSDQRHHRIERIEQKMRIELRLQRAELRLREIFSHARGHHALRLPVGIPAKRHLRTDDRAKEHDEDVAIRTNTDDTGALQSPPLRQSKGDRQLRLQQDLHKNDRDAKGHMHHEGSSHSASFKRYAIANGPDEHGHTLHSPHIPSCESSNAPSDSSGLRREGRSWNPSVPTNAGTIQNASSKSRRRRSGLTALTGRRRDGARRWRGSCD